MYSPYPSDTQYPHGPELGPMRGQMPVDAAGSPARYPYMSYYGHKGPEGAQLAAAMSQRPPYGGEYGMANPEAMYNQGWSAMMAGQGGYMAGKPGPYGVQSVGGYPGAAPGYPGPPHPFPSGGQYPPYGSAAMAAAAAAAAGHPGMIQQQALSSRHRFTPPTEGGASTGSRPDMSSAGVVDGPSYPGGVPGGMLPHGSGSPGPPWQSPMRAGGSRGFRGGDQSSPAPATSGSSWPPGPPYPGPQGPDYPPGGPSTPNSSQGQSSSSTNSKLKDPDKASKQGVSQKGEILSPLNTELRKAGSISSLRDALLATTASSTPSRQYASYSSPKMEHLGSPATPSTNHPMTPESSSVISPQISVTATARQDSQLLCAGGQGVNPEGGHTPYSRQNSAIPGGKDARSNNPSQPSAEENNRPFKVDSILGLKGDRPTDPGVKQSSSPVGNSLRDGIGEGGSGLNSPHTQSPMTGSLLTPGTGGVGAQEGGQGPAPGRPDLLGFPTRSPSFRGGDKQPSPLTEDGKTARKMTMSPIDRSHPSISSQYNGDQKRKEFLDSLFSYLEKEGIQLVRLPNVCKAPFDLYQIFNSVLVHGGFLNVMEKRLWRDVIKTACGSNSNPTSSSSRTVQQYYAKLLLPYECHLNNLDISTCLMKLENSVSRRTSISSPCSQISSDSESKDRTNHLPDASKFDSVEGRVNGETMCVMPGSTLMDGEHVVKRVNSQEPSSGTNNIHLNSNSTGVGDASHHPPPPQRATPQDSNTAHPAKVGNSFNHDEERGLGVGGFSEDSQNSYSQAAALAEPLPEMSVQDAESVLGMSPTPFPASQDGPTTPSAGVPSPTPFPPGHFAQQPAVPNAPPTLHQPGTPGSVGTPTGGRGGAGGSQEYASEMNEMGGASTPGLGGGGGSSAPPSYPPPYPDMAGYLPSYGPGNYPPYSSSSYHRQYDIPPDYHPGVPSHMMRPPYPSNQFPGMSHGGHHPMDYPGQYHPHLVHGGMRDPSMYPGGHGMSSADWHWHQQQQQHQQQQRQQQMMSPFPPHLQQSQMYHRMQQHHQQQQAMNALRHQQQQAAMAAALQQSGSRGTPSTPTSGSPGGMMDHKIQWQDQNSAATAAMAHKNPSLHKMHHDKALTSPKPQIKHHLHPEMGGDNKVPPGGGKVGGVTSEAAKRSHPDWSNCVEGTKPHLIKRRKLYSINCGHVEPWRLMMSLKSGLLADSTWALDTLTILLHDESTYGYFNLKHHHSLLDTIVSHFKVLLTTIFDMEFEDTKQYISGVGKVPAMKTGQNYVVDKEKEPGKEPNGEPKGKEKEADEKADPGDDTACLMTELLMSACQTDYDVLSEVASCAAGKEGEPTGTEPGGGGGGVGSSLIPVASVYSSKDIKKGKSDDLSHIAIPTLDDPVFPEEDVHLEIVSEQERLRMDREFLLQRVDQTPVSVLLQREALLTKIPLHRFGRLSHSPRRRERNFFGDMRRRESMSIDEEKSVENSGAAEKGETPAAAAATVSEAGVGKAEDKCRSPEALQAIDRASTSSSPVKKDLVASPIMKEEGEVYRKEELPLWAMSPTKEDLESRCKCVSNILRSLTFVPGNDVEFCQHSGILIILGQLLMMHHYHLLRSNEKRRVAASAQSDDSTSGGDDTMELDSGFDVRKVDDQKFPPAKDYWWWKCVDVLREDTLVILANISGQLDLSIFPEKVSFPIIDGLLHWLVCPSSIACDPLPDSSKVYSQSPQRLVVETLAKMTISEVNVDLILATPPLMRLDLLFSHLGQMVGQKKHPVVRQFALVLLSNLAQGNEAASRLICQQKMVVSLLLECLEISEQMACMGQGTLDGGYAKDDPTSLSVAMLRRAASTLHFLSRVPANRTAFLPYKDRLLYLSTSQYVEPSVSSILMDMLFEFSKL